MTSAAMQHDIGEFLKGVFGLIGNVVTAGGGGDGTLQNGAIIDRLSTSLFGDAPSLALSALVVVPVSTTLASAETTTIALKVQDGAQSNLSDAADFGTAPTDLVLGPGVGTFTGAHVQKVDLGAAKQFLRCVVTPTLSASATDTAAIAAIWVFGGFDELPV